MMNTIWGLCLVKPPYSKSLNIKDLILLHFLAHSSPIIHPLCLLLLRYIHPKGTLLGWRQKTCSIFLRLYPFNLRNCGFLTHHMSIYGYLTVTPLHDHSASLLHPICSQKLLPSMPTNTDNDHRILGLKFYPNFLQVYFRQQYAFCTSLS